MSGRVFGRGFSVRVFLPNGDPDGIKLVEKSNWTGRGIVFPRVMYSEAKKMEELERTGVYILVGPSESSALPKAYVGEGDPVGPRLDQHARQKDFWTHAVVFTSKDANLNKAHVQQLEARLVRLAQASKRCVLDNANAPGSPSLSAADLAEVEGFLDDLLLCLPILGYGFFEQAPVASAPIQRSEATPSAQAQTVARETVELKVRAKGIEATGFESPSGFVVRAGSQAVKDDKLTPSFLPHLLDIRAELVRLGVLIDVGACYQFGQDYAFASPSTAAGVVMGRSANGRTEWKADDGRILKQIQDGAEPPIVNHAYLQSGGTMEPAMAPGQPLAVVELVIHTKGIEAIGHESLAGFVVREGSGAVGDGSLVPSTPELIRNVRMELVRQGVLVSTGLDFRFSRDHIFNSPSTAAGVVMGRSANGRMEWATGDGRTLKAIQEASGRG